MGSACAFAAVAYETRGKNRSIVTQYRLMIRCMYNKNTMVHIIAEECGGGVQINGNIAVQLSNGGGLDMSRRRRRDRAFARVRLQSLVLARAGVLSACRVPPRNALDDAAHLRRHRLGTHDVPERPLLALAAPGRGLRSLERHGRRLDGDSPLGWLRRRRACNEMRREDVLERDVGCGGGRGRRRRWLWRPPYRAARHQSYWFVVVVCTTPRQRPICIGEGKLPYQLCFARRRGTRA